MPASSCCSRWLRTAAPPPRRPACLARLSRLARLAPPSSFAPGHRTGARAARSPCRACRPAPAPPGARDEPEAPQARAGRVPDRQGGDQQQDQHGSRHGAARRHRTRRPAARPSPNPPPLPPHADAPLTFTVPPHAVWPQIKKAIASNQTVEHIGLFGNDANMDDDLPAIYKTLDNRRAQREKREVDTRK